MLIVTRYIFFTELYSLVLYVIARRALPDVAIYYINLPKEIPTLISFARNDGRNCNTKLYIPVFLYKLVPHMIYKYYICIKINMDFR